ncbi:hypothetical protein VNO78_09383 [Psophocarpus tetragonolobus]|uniref:Uncharacterized protein n=1 Tax=Psophocarpus tetragonolobus TaxID=3891 RepID=A0AAN9SY99_PSOTE
MGGFCSCFRGWHPEEPTLNNASAEIQAETFSLFSPDTLNDASEHSEPPVFNIPGKPRSTSSDEDVCPTCFEASDPASVAKRLRSSRTTHLKKGLGGATITVGFLQLIVVAGTVPRGRSVRCIIDEYLSLGVNTELFDDVTATTNDATDLVDRVEVAEDSVVGVDK